MADDKLVIAGREFNSRLMVGTGKYASFQQMAQALEGKKTPEVALADAAKEIRTKQTLG